MLINFPVNIIEKEPFSVKEVVASYQDVLMGKDLRITSSPKLRDFFDGNI